MNDFCPPVHQLQCNSKSCYILQDGHHRTAIYAYLKKNFPSKISNNSNNLCKKLTVLPQLIVHREHIPRMRLCSYINKKTHFCLTDAYKWFDLSFEILDIKIESLPHEVTILSRIHDKLVNKQ
ncbi:hypothetical protein OA866_00750 [bacterium]|nr:hypothetical protein [bacterium]